MKLQLIAFSIGSQYSARSNMKIVLLWFIIRFLELSPRFLGMNMADFRSSTPSK
jgi:hypothetical protein